MKKILYFFVFTALFSQESEHDFSQSDFDKENNLLFSPHYLYPQRYMQKILCLARTLCDDLQDVQASFYEEKAAQSIYMHAQGMKKTMRDLLAHPEEVENYLQDDTQEMIDIVRKIDRMIIALMVQARKYQEILQRSHEVLCVMYLDAKKLALRSLD